MTRDELRAQLQKYLDVAAFLAKITPNQVDDKVIALLQQAVSQDWLLDLLLTFISRQKSLTLDEVAQAVASAKLSAA